MFESAETKKQWLTDLEYSLKDILTEIKKNIYKAEIESTEIHVEQAIKAMNKEEHIESLKQGLPEALIGRTITGIRTVTEEELEDNVWQEPSGFGSIITLDDGTEIWALQDEEGNGMGVLMHVNKDQQCYVQRG